ncbi:Gfo/Idh/MocA family oxidoreductase [Neobacillus sp. YX16]|uniref:Gfo/Idh/MocA family protein n=1 Tax=Neobacillus sp. YX16 TaxID=3047874 RepID=UPI0024C24956|nr:Gfo/Idh/MocA family oxidoreductase [Neobacillus sp. YX16]WHZ03706.1 Gfo/Idh/MocA family oxidoreductase [Neobacillus sp. YX16]
MEKVRWGILSTAKIAQKSLIPAFERANNAVVTGIASSSGKAEEAAAQFNIAKAYSSYEAMLQDPDIDAVYIPLPNHLHKKWTFEAAKRGKHILCEKPASLTAEETKEMVDFCRESNVKFMEAFMYQFHPQHERVREIIKSGEIGEVKYMRASFSFFLAQPEGNVRMDSEKGGGSLYDVGCYAIHSIRKILGAEPVEVDVHANIHSDYQVDTSAFGYMKMENGVHALFDCSFDMVFRAEYEVIGTEGQIKVPRAFRPDNHGGEGLVIVQIGEETREEKIVADIYREEVEHISQVILENGEPSYSGENAIQNMRVIEACYQSIHTGNIIKLV